eukprot:TRINITY_DN861_c0_g1_i3.p1 TRINITY_DN861_c0_g1~~TRINITY_DN861_c0_g1_i3.p1  ORF type:complete len:480 (+),score=132.19 TRINITY_DN861_c0_g1_i3:189-1628(+)
MNLQQEYLKAVTRRHFFGQAGVGLGAVALASLLQRDGIAAPPAAINPLAPKQPPLPAKAKHVIYLHMAGSPTQLDLFDYKPTLQKYNGKPCPKEYLEGKRFAFIQGVPNMLGTPFQFAKHGQSGAELSEVWKFLPEVIDDIAIVKSMQTEQFNHAPAQLFLQTGTNLFGGAAMGSWATYGLGSNNEDLPGFVVLTSGGKTPDAGKSVWGSGYLPSIYQGVQCRSPGDPVLFLSNPNGLDRAGRRETLDALRTLNEFQAEKLGDPETITRIAQYELAYRMQSSVPELADLSKETEATLSMYGDEVKKPGTFANNALMARRLVERGVRFVQIYINNWDTHANVAGRLPSQCRDVDQPCYALIQDLKQRGLFDETLIIWGGEFGRTIYSQGGLSKENYGRDHHPRCFTMWMAGGGAKGGTIYGETDDFSYNIVKDPVHIHDFHATVLHLLGFDHEKFSYRYQGLDQRLTGVEPCRVVKELLA